MTLNEIISILAERSNRAFDAAYIKQLKEIVISHRYRFLRDTLNKNPQDRRHFLQTIKVEIEETKDLSVIDCGSTTKVKVTKVKVPSPVRSGSMLFDYVGGTKINAPYTYIDPVRMSFLFKGKYGNKSIPYYTYIDGMIYTINAKGKTLSVNGVFADPRKLVDMMGYDDDIEFPASFDLTQLIINEVLRTELNVQVPENADQEVELK